MSEYVVEMRGISKSFGEVHAVREGEFTLKKGEIHSLIGENGAGKSTMMKLLYGMYPIDSGEFIIKGERITKLDPGTANPQSDPVLVTLPKIIKPSSANAGVFIAAGVVVLVIVMLYKTKWGYKIRTVGTNPYHADYVGINSKKVFINAMLLSGMLGGIAGCIEVLGVHGYYLDNFAKDLGTNGMLAALIVKSNMIFTPFMAFFLAVLKAGAMAMQQSTGGPKSIVDTISAIFIIVATMELLFQFNGKRKALAAQKKEMAAKTGGTGINDEAPKGNDREGGNK